MNKEEKEEEEGKKEKSPLVDTMLFAEANNSWPERVLAKTK